MFKRLPHQVADAIAEEIGRRAWIGVLPAERTLAEKYQVSRRTIRAALRELRHRGIIAGESGRASIASRRVRSRKRPSAPRIGLLVPNPLGEMKQFTLMWVGQLATGIREAGGSFEVVEGASYFRGAGQAALTRLTHERPKDCWILARSTQRAQLWFQRSQTPAIIAGSAHPGVTLPSVDLDYRAACRHAAGELRRRGYRQVGFIYENDELAGDNESITGFMEGWQAHEPALPPPLRACNHRDLAETVRLLQRWLARPTPPQALLLSSPQLYLTVASYLATRRLRVPEDVALLCRDVEPYFGSLVPAPAHYRCLPARFAAAMLKSVMSTLHGETSGRVKIIPDFVPGASLASRG